MPTQSTTYNSRVTDEALEKRFRDTFRSQGGAELVDDLYAQGVIVPIVDFTAAATGQQLAENLQTAWDFTTGYSLIQTTPVTFISNSGFWRVSGNASVRSDNSGHNASISLSDGLSTKVIWEFNTQPIGAAYNNLQVEFDFIVFLRSGDSLSGVTAASNSSTIDVWYRQIATVNGDLVDPSGFTSS